MIYSKGKARNETRRDEEVMKAAVLYEHGGRDVLRIAHDLPVPQPGAGEVRLKMHAAALNRLDLWVREGWKGLNLHMPHIGGSDGAGVVDAIGAGVYGVTPGDRVCVDPTIIPPSVLETTNGDEVMFGEGVGIMGEHYPGFAADYIVVPARNCLKLPDGAAYDDAAAAGLVYVTAWASLIRKGGLRAGETVLIVGAGGGVNTASLQIAKLAGARVIVVGSNAERCAAAAALGADVTINRADEANWSKTVYSLTGKRGVDVVIDNVGAATLFDSIRAVRKGGRILIVGATSGPKMELDIRYLFSKQISLIGSTMGAHEDYVRVMKLVFDGALKPVIGARLPLEEIAEGHRLLETGEVFGKVVLEIG
jgi:NADPH:quinone reductase-like Zn-dependent oxidoreductase